MITVKVYFDFNTKDEWIEFGKKFYSIKEFEPGVFAAPIEEETAREIIMKM